MSGRCFVVVAPRSNEMWQWLRCNDVDPNLVPYKSSVFVESADGEKWVVRHDAYLRSATGSLVYDAAAREFLFEERTVPLLNDPPMWWLSETAPTGDGAASAGSVGAETSTDSEYTVAEGAFNCD